MPADKPPFPGKDPEDAGSSPDQNKEEKASNPEDLHAKEEPLNERWLSGVEQGDVSFPLNERYDVVTSSLADEQGTHKRN